MQTLQIRDAQAEDVPALLSIYAPYVENTAITFEYDVPSVEEFAGRLETVRRRYPYLAAWRDGKLIGYAYASAFKGRRAYDWAVETSIYIERNSRGTGAGRALYAELERRLRLQNVTNVNACITSPRGEDPYLTDESITFHAHLGYEKVGVFHCCGYKFGRWYDMMWMEKMIAEHGTPHPAFIPWPELPLGEPGSHTVSIC